MTGNGHAIPGTPIAVDMWNTRSHPESHVFFLSHFHSDHVVGLSSSWEYPIYTSEITAKLVAKKLKIKPSLLRILSVGEEYLIPLDNDEKETVSVTLYDANHCPGSVMFLFQGYFGNVLYTGGFRFSPELLASLKLPAIDLLYLDNTYSSPRCEFGTREDTGEAILHRLHECLQTSKRVFLGLDDLGKEELLKSIFGETHSKVCVGAARLETLEILGYSDFVTTNSSKAKVIAVSTNQITGFSVSRWNAEMRTCAFLPTARYCGFDIKPYSQHPNIHVIPYSNHSPFKELQIFVKHVCPRCIVPIVGRHVLGVFGTDISERSNMCVFSTLLADSPRSDFVIPTSVQSAMKFWSPKNFARKAKRLRRNSVAQKKLESVRAPKDVAPENTLSSDVASSSSSTNNQQKITKARRRENVYEIVLIKECKVYKIVT